MKTNLMSFGTAVAIGSLLWIGTLNAGFRSAHVQSKKTMCYEACHKHYDVNGSSFKKCMEDCLRTGVVKE